MHPRWVMLLVCVGCASKEAPPPATPPPAHATPPPRVSHHEPPPASPPPAAKPRGVYEVGYASWYGKALAGHPTASGERFVPSKLTAAHRTLRLGTWVQVRRTDNGRTVTVKVNDRGPVSHRFIIDLSSGAAQQLGMLKMGVAPVEIRILR